MLRNLFLVSSLTVFTFVSSAQSQSLSVPPDAARGAERRQPDVSVQEQPGTPLRLSVGKAKWATPDQQMLEVYVVVENVSEMEIRAYSVRSGGVEDIQDTNTCLLNNIQSPGKVLRPGDSDSKSLWRRISLDSSPRNIDLSLDFVEFANGSTWGTDACQSAERLRGIRAGAVAARDKLERMLEQNSGRALVGFSNSDALRVEMPEGHSPVWIEGFQGGVRTLLERVRKANEEGGLPEAQRVLRLPFDAAEK